MKIKRFFKKLSALIKKIKEKSPIKKLDWYIIKKFIGTYIFSIVLIMAISIVFDVNENLDKFTSHNAPLKEIVFDYYGNFIPYLANLFSALFVFISVIFFTSKMAGNSEIIAILASGVSFKRFMRPYMISAALITALTFYLGSEVIPRGTVKRLEFETKYKNKRRQNTANNVMLQVNPGVIAYIQFYDNDTQLGQGFSLDQFEGKKLVSHLTARTISYDSISDTRYRWHLRDYRIRDMRGLKEKITSGRELDTIIIMEPMDLVYTKGQQETLTSPELYRYITKQTERGSGNVVQYEVEYHKRIASSFAAFILTTIGVSLSSRKRKGGMGLYLGIGLALSFSYIMLQTVSSTFAIQADTPPLLAAWIPNILFAFIAYFCYRQAPN